MKPKKMVQQGKNNLDLSPKIGYNEIRWKTWGYGAVGSALEWHSRGRRFESVYLHQRNRLKSMIQAVFTFWQNV